jgi:hypothetical protein
VNVLSDDYKRIDLVDPIDGFIVLAVDTFVTTVHDWIPDEHSVAFWCQ